MPHFGGTDVETVWSPTNLTRVPAPSTGYTLHHERVPDTLTCTMRAMTLRQKASSWNAAEAFRFVFHVKQAQLWTFVAPPQADGKGC